MKRILNFLPFLFLLNFSMGNCETINGIQLKNIIDKWLLGNNIESNIKILDQMRYPKCNESDLIINDISGTFKLIKVSCLAPNNWSFIVRNKVQSKKNLKTKKESSETEVFTLKHQKRSGSTISEDDIIKISKKISNTNGLVRKKSDLIGKKLSKSVSANRALYYSSIKKEWMIEKDSEILIENKQNNITIRARGIALENADFMEKVKVKNLKSGKIVYGFAKNKKKILLNTKQN